MSTTCMGVMWMQISLNLTTSLNRMVTSGNTCREMSLMLTLRLSELDRLAQPGGLRRGLGGLCTWQVSSAVIPFLRRSATALGIMAYSSESPLFFSSSSFLMISCS